MFVIRFYLTCLKISNVGGYQRFNLLHKLLLHFDDCYDSILMVKELV